MTPKVRELIANRETSLSHALETLIQQANRHQDSERMLKLYAHRMALQNHFQKSEDSTHTFEQDLVYLIQQYADYLPVLIDDFSHQCFQLGWADVAEKTDQIIASFFARLNQPRNHVGLLTLLDKVYFAHRMIEEIHDYMMCHTGQPTVTWNMTSANLIIHQLLGSEYSSRLDQSAIELAQKITSEAPSPELATEKKGPNEIWPCFCERYGLSYAF
jgi:hypothetical protein